MTPITEESSLKVQSTLERLAILFEGLSMAN